MDIQRAKELLTVLAEGVDPLTGEVLPDDHVCNKGEIVRALNCAVEELSRRRKKPLPENNGKPWTEELDDELCRLFDGGNQAVGHKRFLYRAYEGSDDILMERVIRSVIQYSNSQLVDTLYTWSGVNNALLRDRYSRQKEERLAAELEKAKALNDADELIAYFDDDIKKLQQQVEQLTKANDALSYENQGLKAKLDSTEDVAVIYLGVEDEFFPGEIKEMILEAVAEKLKNTAPKSRRHDVLSDIIQKNGFEGTAEKRANSVKILLKDYRTMSGTLRQALMDLGFTITEDGKHYRLTYYGDGRYKTTVSKTASDHREGKNIASAIIKNMF